MDSVVKSMCLLYIRIYVSALVKCHRYICYVQRFSKDVSHPYTGFYSLGGGGGELPPQTP